MSTTQSQHLYHDPAGRQHPYEFAPFERQPAQPEAGQPVTIGAVSRPADAFEEVWTEWQRKGEAVRKVAAGQKTQQDREEAHWRMDLPAFQYGEHIEYRVCGRTAQGLETTQKFDFKVVGWQRAALQWNTVKVANAGLLLSYQVAGQMDALRLHIWFCLGMVRFAWGDTFTLPADAVLPVLQMGEREMIAQASGVRLRIGHEGLLEISRTGQEPLFIESRSPEFLVGENNQLLKIHQSFQSPPDEAFYGFGERYNSLDQRGNSVDVRVFEQYKGQGLRTYLPMPFFLSSRKYGFFLNSSRWSAFDLANSEAQCWSYQAELGLKSELQGVLFTGNSMKDNLQAYSQVTGKPALPPDWAFGLWVSSNDWDSQEKVLEQLRLAQEHDIPASALVIEAWSDEINFYAWNDSRYTPKAQDQPFHLNDFSFPSEGRWPDPKRMIEQLHDANVRLILWQIPVLKQPKAHEIFDLTQHDADEAYMIDQGLCVQMPDRSPYRVRSPWFQGSLLMDFSNPAAKAWWFGKRRYLLDELGVDGFKTDGGEHLWCREACFADERTGEEHWNEYPNYYQGAYTDFVHEHLGEDGMLFSRSGFTGAQKFPAHWTGDENSTWEAYRSAVLAMQNAGLSGIPFIGWDLAGFSGPLPDAELYLRSAAMAVFCPIMQYHSEYWRKTPSRDRTPWNMQACTGDERIIPVFRQFVRLRQRLMTYTLAEAKKCSESGLPLMRPLLLEFPDDAAVKAYPYQYLFGEALLVAPVVDPGITTMKVYLPNGSWRNLWTGALQSGAQEIEVACPIDQIPVFIRAGFPFDLD